METNKEHPVLSILKKRYGNAFFDKLREDAKEYFEAFDAAPPVRVASRWLLDNEFTNEDHAEEAAQNVIERTVDNGNT